MAAAAVLSAQACGRLLAGGDQAAGGGGPLSQAVTAPAAAAPAVTAARVTAAGVTVPAVAAGSVMAAMVAAAWGLTGCGRLPRSRGARPGPAGAAALRGAAWGHPAGSRRPSAERR